MSEINTHTDKCAVAGSHSPLRRPGATTTAELRTTCCDRVVATHPVCGEHHDERREAPVPCPWCGAGESALVYREVRDASHV